MDKPKWNTWNVEVLIPSHKPYKQKVNGIRFEIIGESVVFYIFANNIIAHFPSRYTIIEKDETI